VLAQAAGTGLAASARWGLGALRDGVKGVITVAFSVSKSRPFRSLGLYKSSGKHAAPKGAVPAPRRSPEGAGHHPAHAATMPRLTGPHADPSAAAEQQAA
jgi:hypothetical protein